MENIEAVKTLEETVVTFNNGHRKASIYCTFPKDGSIEIKVGVEPEIVKGEQPDSVILLANIFLSALKGDDPKDEVKSDIYDGQN